MTIYATIPGATSNLDFFESGFPKQKLTYSFKPVSGYGTQNIQQIRLMNQLLDNLISIFFLRFLFFAESLHVHS